MSKSETLVRCAPIDYERLVRGVRMKLRAQTQQNIADDTLSPDEVSKLNSAAVRHGLTQEQIKAEIKKSPLLASLLLTKDPAKQSIHQRTAAQMLSTWLLPFSSFSSPPSGGPNSEHIVSGVLIKGDAVHKNSSKGKSIDFIFEFDGTPFLTHKLRFHASHKYTKESGGSQDNQYHDIQEFVRHCKPNGEETFFFLAIADGAYYNANSTFKNSSHQFISKREALTRDANSRISALQSHEVPQWVALVIEREFKNQNQLVPIDLQEQLDWMKSPSTPWSWNTFVKKYPASTFIPPQHQGLAAKILLAQIKAVQKSALPAPAVVGNLIPGGVHSMAQFAAAGIFPAMGVPIHPSTGKSMQSTTLRPPAKNLKSKALSPANAPASATASSSMKPSSSIPAGIIGGVQKSSLCSDSKKSHSKTGLNTLKGKTLPSKSKSAKNLLPLIQDLSALISVKNKPSPSASVRTAF